MIIKTKYDIGETVYTIDVMGDIVSLKIGRIEINDRGDIIYSEGDFRNPRFIEYQLSSNPKKLKYLLKKEALRDYERRIEEIDNMQL